ncbi:hypothetical protein B0H34DRAFT_677312 [Crassisporium funariophilum]|nr:hypothetical protein B0H34DRAFT_677312 [Crassisporium funariophilum]
MSTNALVLNLSLSSSPAIHAPIPLLPGQDGMVHKTCCASTTHIPQSDRMFVLKLELVKPSDQALLPKPSNLTQRKLNVSTNFPSGQASTSSSPRYTGGDFFWLFLPGGWLSTWLAVILDFDIFFFVLIVLESPVQSGILAQNAETRTKTGPHIF